MKRFWKEVSVAEAEGGWQILLDGRNVRTPAKREVIVPQQAMANRIAAEWAATAGEIQPLEMPMTRTAATCLDRVAPEVDAVRADISGYGGTDLLCYRAPFPAGLADRQRLCWDPVLDWARNELGADLVLAEGVMHVAQSVEAEQALSGAVKRFDAWALTCVADLVTISGSLVLGLAVSQSRLTGEEAWNLSRIDEDWNIEEWGEDAEATTLAARKKADFLHATEVLDLLGVRAG